MDAARGGCDGSTGNAVHENVGAGGRCRRPAWERPRAPNPRGERRPRRDIGVKDGDFITLGTTTVKLHVLGGHTPGTLGVDFTVYDAGKPYRAFMLGGAAPGPGRPAAEEFLASVNRMEQMQDDVQVRVVTHAWMDSDFWGRTDRLASRAGRPASLRGARRVSCVGRGAEDDRDHAARSREGG